MKPALNRKLIPAHAEAELAQRLNLAAYLGASASAGGAQAMES